MLTCNERAADVSPKNGASMSAAIRRPLVSAQSSPQGRLELAHERMRSYSDNPRRQSICPELTILEEEIHTPLGPLSLRTTIAKPNHANPISQRCQNIIELASVARRVLRHSGRPHCINRFVSSFGALRPFTMSLGMQQLESAMQIHEAEVSPRDSSSHCDA
jgi:hypothetical protein